MLTADPLRVMSKSEKARLRMRMFVDRKSCRFRNITAITRELQKTERRVTISIQNDRSPYPNGDSRVETVETVETSTGVSCVTSSALRSMLVGPVFPDCSLRWNSNTWKMDLFTEEWSENQSKMSLNLISWLIKTKIQITDYVKLDIGTFMEHEGTFVRWFFNKIKHDYV